MEKVLRTLKCLIFLIAPVVIFILMESYEHNPFAEVRPEAFWFNIILFELLALILLGIAGNGRGSLRILAVLAMAFGITNHYVMAFRSTPFVPWDLLSIRTAASVAGNYDFTPDGRMIIVTLLFLALIGCLHFLKPQTGGLYAGRRRIVYGIMALVSTCILIGFTGRLQDESFQNRHRLYPFLFTPAYMTKVNGMAVTFTMNLAYLKIDKPAGYRTEDAEALLQQYAGEEEEKTDVVYPNIIVIMDEAFSDLAVLGEVNASQDYMPFVHSLQEGAQNTITGYLNVSVCGGNTADTEYEFLTGNTMRFLPAGSIPYQQYIKNEMPSLASYLTDLGYASYTLHPYYASGWERNRVYPLLGFDTSYFIEDLTHPAYLRKYVSDKSDMEEIIRIYESKKEGTPAFIFNVTMQNHGGYTDTYNNFREDITAEGKNNASLDQYLSLIKRTDEAFEELIAYFKEQEEPTILLLFGDHQPNNAVAKSFDCTDETLRYQVPYVIWANYDIPGQSGVDTSVNYLSTHLLDAAGVPRYDYQNFLADLEQYYPILSAARQETAGAGNEELLADYDKLQYYLLFDRKGESK
ncbi:MAG: LTA synthase family protein [Agathobacter sp.]|nr:LTA synthase family protein [Agathobacter sp.]